MGRRALEFSRAHPDPSAGYAAALSQLEQRLATANDIAAVQRNGILQERVATTRKRELRAAITFGHVSHLVGAARMAEAESPGIMRKLLLPRTPSTFQAFRIAAGTIAAEATAQRELLVKYGVSDAVLDDLEHSLDQFDAAMNEADVGRRTHVGATARLIALADEVVGAVGVLDGLNRLRFAGNAETLAEWESASSIRAYTPSESEPDDGTPGGGEKAA